MTTKNKSIGVALSGGKDSVAMLLVMIKNINKIDNPEIISYTLEGWGLDQKNTYQYARGIPKKYNIKHKVIPKKRIVEVFNLSTDFDKVFDTISATKKLTQNEKTLVLAQTQRRMAEISASEDKIFDLFFALNKEDLLSEVMLTYTTGHLAFSIPVRKVDPFTYYYPLTFLTKKEVAIYLDLNHPEYINQEKSSAVELRSQTAQFHIKLCDDLFEIWPGIKYDLFNAYKRITEYMRDKIVLGNCENCGSTLVNTTKEKPLLCGGCKVYKKLGFLKDD